MKNMAVNEMKFYQILITIAFSVDSGHPYYYIFRYIIYLGLFNCILSLIIAPLYMICEGQNMSIIMELILYMMCGILHSMHLIVITLNKQSIVTTYNCIQTSFVGWSVKKGMDPNGAYKINIKIIKYFVTIWSFLGCTIMFSPLLSTVADLGELPLDHQSHWSTHWPMLFSVNNLYTYGLIYLVQTILAMFLITATGAMKCGFIMILSEVNYQFEHLLYGLEQAFNHRIEQQFKIVFLDCILHHQLIIKYVDNFKSYFKWITLINIIMLEGIISTSFYCIIKVDAPLGYKIKLCGIIITHIAEFVFHCYLGEIILRMHNRLAEKVYNMTWYNMPNQHKKLLVIMFQRTQKDLIPNAAIFSSQVLSRSLITKFVKQIYTLLNFLLKT